MFNFYINAKFYSYFLFISSLYALLNGFRGGLPTKVVPGWGSLPSSIGLNLVYFCCRRLYLILSDYNYSYINYFSSFPSSDGTYLGLTGGKGCSLGTDLLTTRSSFCSLSFYAKRPPNLISPTTLSFLVSQLFCYSMLSCVWFADSGSGCIIEIELLP